MDKEETLFERVACTISRYRMLEPGQRVGVAVSGGADSVCLLHVLRELAPRWNLHLMVLHLNHMLRGRESDQDAGFVRCLAAGLNVPVENREADLRNAGDNLEQAAREARQAFFSEMMAAHKLDRVATGHTRTDQAETVLFRFLRGAGTAGLAGIRPVTAEGTVRPLLEVERAEIEPFLRERNLAWREDSSNRSLEFARNRIRHELLPQVARDWNPAIHQTLAQMAEWALAEEEYWEAEVGRLAAARLNRQNGFVLLETVRLAELPLAARRRLVRRAMEEVRGDLKAIGFSHIEAVLHLAGSSDGHGRVQVPGVDVMRSFEWLRFATRAEGGIESRNYRLPVTVPGSVAVPGTSLVISLQVFEKSEIPELDDSVYNEEMVLVDWERLSSSLALRNWRPGDQYQPAGRAGQEKIKTLFQEFRIPLWDRRHWPVLTDGESIVWVRRFGAAASFAAQSTSRKLLKIQEIGIEREPGCVYKSVTR